MRRLDNRGQTLIALLIFMMLAVTLTMTAVIVTVTNLQATTSFATGDQALDNARTGVENALLQLERKPTYKGETLTLPSGSAKITVSGSGTLTIKSTGTSGNMQRIITATATYANNTVTLVSQTETP